MIHPRLFYWSVSLIAAPALAFIACNNEGEGPLPVIPPTATTVVVAHVDAAAPVATKDAGDDGSVEFGMIGLLHTSDEDGGMWGDTIGDAFGVGGLGLSGIGEGDGGRGEGIGLGTFGQIGHGSGTGSSTGFGVRPRSADGGTPPQTPKVRMGATTVTGKLPPEVIQRIVRQNFGRFRLCYESGLRSNPKLDGTVSTRFVIGKDGSVGSVGNAGSTMTDQAVVQCVVRAFGALYFPSPESGVVVVIFPISFSPN